MNMTELAQAPVFFAAGLIIGTLYFFLLEKTVASFTSGTPLVQIIPLYLARVIVAFAAFWVIAQVGATALLTALLGFLVARHVARRRARAA